MPDQEKLTLNVQGSEQDLERLRVAIENMLVSERRADVRIGWTLNYSYRYVLPEQLQALKERFR